LEFDLRTFATSAFSSITWKAHANNSARTRNVRLGAVHSFFRYVTLEEPAHALHCQRILAVPNKRHEQRPSVFSTEKRSTHYSPSRIAPPGWGIAIDALAVQPNQLGNPQAGLDRDQKKGSVAVSGRSGVQRCFLPFPRQRT